MQWLLHDSEIPLFSIVKGHGADVGGGLFGNGRNTESEIREATNEFIGELGKSSFSRYKVRGKERQTRPYVSGYDRILYSFCILGHVPFGGGENEKELFDRISYVCCSVFHVPSEC